MTLYKGRTLHRETRGNWQCADVRMSFSRSDWKSLVVAEQAPSLLMQCAEVHNNPVLFAKVDDFCAHMVEVHDAPELEVG